jgi:hypothetical protein
MLLEAALSAAISIYCIVIMAACARWAGGKLAGRP